LAEKVNMKEFTARNKKINMEKVFLRITEELVM
jgi:hypothetical protein